MEQSVESNSFEKFKAIASRTLPILFAHNSDIFFKKRFSKNPANMDMGILLLKYSNNSLY